MSELADTTVRGVVTQTEAATDDTHLVRLGEARTMLNALFQGAWDSGAGYTAGQSVTDDGAFWIAKLDSTNKKPAGNPTYWRAAAVAGASSYSYVGYATDASGTGFSTSPAGKTFVAFKTSAVPLTPVVGDFAGLWVQFVGSVGSITTTSVAEGTNLYFTTARVLATALTGLATGSGGAIVAADTVLAAFGKAEHRLTAIEAWTSDSVNEGATNLYFTNARARGALSATGPATYNSTSGAIGINAASANTASYVVQRDGNGDFAARKITLGTGAAADHLTLGGTATIGYDGSKVAFNTAIGVATVTLASSHELRTASSNLQLYSFGDSANVFTTSGKTLIVGALQLTGATGVVKTNGSGLVQAGAATTDDVGEGATNLYYTAARVNSAADARIALQKGANSGLATLDSGGKLTIGQLPASVVGAVVYQGTWNATTNSPALAGGTGTKGFYYKVGTAGSTNLDGITDWQVGDWAIFNGAAWEKVDNTDLVASVAGKVGVVTLDTGDVTEGSNLYFTTARVLATALTGFAATTGAITAADTVLSGLNKAQGRLAAIEAWTTTSVTEGANLYYTDARVKSLAAAGLNSVIVAPAASTSGSPKLLTVTGPAHTGLTASAEASDVYLALSRVVEFSTGALATQRAVQVEAPKYAFVATSVLTDASTMAIAGAPVAWSNATLTNAAGLRIYGGAVAGGNTNAYGLYVDAPTGGTNNYGAVFVTGNVGIGTAAPSLALDIASDSFRLRTAKTPSSASDTGVTGEVCWDAGFVYVCVGTNTWKRAAIATW